MGVSEVVNPGNEVNTLQSFSDTIAGRSFQLFYGVAIPTAATAGVISSVDHILTRDVGFSLPEGTNGTAGSTITCNFDITVNKCTFFSGIAHLDIKVESSSWASCSVNAKLYHYDGVNETEIGNFGTTLNLVLSPVSYKLKATITKKIFNPSSVLRLKLTVITAAGQTCSVYHNPSVAGNELKLWMPVMVFE